MEEKHEFFTVRGYELQEQAGKPLTPGMEDYLEMIFRLSIDKKYIRINDLASALNVQPPSATRMVQKLADYKYIHYEKYGFVELTTLGEKIGGILYQRHNTLEKFFKHLGVKINVLEDTEKIEHYLSHEALHNIIKFVEFVQLNPKFLKPFHQYLNENLQNKT